MSEPSREHVEAVAEHLAPKPLSYYRQGYHGTEPDAVRSYFKRAERILTSTDPAVLDAMQDALVRAGRLDWETEWFVRDGYGEARLGVLGEVSEPYAKRRLVTEWQEES